MKTLGSSTEDSTNENVNLLQDIDRLEKETSDLRKDIFHLHSQLIPKQPKLYENMPHPPIVVKVIPAQMAEINNYSVKLNHKFYEFTGVSIKHFTSDLLTVYFYPKHDDWASIIKPYWLNIKISEFPRIMSYDLPFMVDMKDMQTRHPIQNNKDVFTFINYIRRCCESFFERRQQVHELEEAVDPSCIKVFADLRHMLVQIKLLAKKSKPEKKFSIWYKEEATLPYQCVVRISDGVHQDLVEKLTIAMEVLNKKSLSKAFIEVIEKCVELEGSTEEFSTDGEDESSDSEAERIGTELTSPSRAIRASGKILAKTKSGRRKAPVKKSSSSDDDSDVTDISEQTQPLAKRLKKLNKFNKQSPTKVKATDGVSEELDSDNKSTIPGERQVHKYQQSNKSEKFRQGEKLQSREHNASPRKRVETSLESRRISEDDSESDLGYQRKSRQTRNSSRIDKKVIKVGNDATVKGKNSKKRVEVRNSPSKVKKSVSFNMLSITKRNAGNKKTVTGLKQQTRGSKGNIASYMTKIS